MLFAWCMYVYLCLRVYPFLCVRVRVRLTFINLRLESVLVLRRRSFT